VNVILIGYIAFFRYTRRVYRVLAIRLTVRRAPRARLTLRPFQPPARPARGVSVVLRLGSALSVSGRVGLDYARADPAALAPR